MVGLSPSGTESKMNMLRPKNRKGTKWSQGEAEDPLPHPLNFFSGYAIDSNLERFYANFHVEQIKNYESIAIQIGPIYFLKLF